MTKEKLFTDKMFLVHTPTGKRFRLAQHWRSGWVVSAWEQKDTEKNYVDSLQEFFEKIYGSYEEFQTNSKDFVLEFESDIT